ncbi:uncharacterized protein AC631_00559 [Debaryomyces fabryi]|uniref:Pseudouridine synthase RsuA/RluA-like domain-containing protein n=1 Tax=Debaryomyces fabryi TaxID=58627 RepID=A0A0V1Q5K0_9ASCO|nr:uncharacterized protein AC631_00559 [Debaryomyces fabryi]KSA03747.1 hypothetical protein AC631_00559 [Debaryomyces fabryi]CUM53290.1 unnamed protein product [Debaryomyces fabryi]
MSTSTIYYFENGLRKVKPYYFTYKTHVKSRWIGKTVHEVFTTELGQDSDVTKQEITNKIIYISSNQGMKGGPIEIKGWNNLVERKIQSHDLIYNMKHIHEPSVAQGLELVKKTTKYTSQSSTDLSIVFENDEVLVVDKPAGIPTHPKGNYRYNSITEIVKHDLNLENIWPCHRLDKVTSGILILGTTQEGGRKYLNIINNNRDRISKQYVARVMGEFPKDEFAMNCPIFLVNTSGGYIMPSNSRNIPTNSTTIFKRLQYNQELNQSIVLCKPVTGRMHQIRIHLRNAGHPIVNDYEYNPQNNSTKQHIQRLRNQIELEMYENIYLDFPSFQEHKSHNLVHDETEVDIVKASKFGTAEIQEKVNKLVVLRSEMVKDMKDQYNKTCDICNRPLFDSDINVDEEGIWLHAFRYEYSDIEPDSSFCFETAFPLWCNI